MSDVILKIDGLCKSFGALTVSDNICLELRNGECLGVIGPNGAGKTTLIHQLSGLLPPDDGTLEFDGRDMTHMPAHMRAKAGLVRSFQVSSVIPSFTVLDNVALAVQARSGSSYRFFGNAAAERSLNQSAHTVLVAVGLNDRHDVAAATLSHGEKRALELAVALALQPKALLLDEPMAGMGREESHRLVDILHNVKKTCPLLLVEHDMDAVFALADRIAVLVYGRIIAEGAPDAVRSNPEVKAAYLGEDTA